MLPVIRAKLAGNHKGYSMSLAPAAALPNGTRNSTPTIRQLGLGDMREALRLGISDWRVCHTEVPMLALLAPVSAIMLAAIVTAPTLMPFFFPVCAGFALLGPMATIWFAALSRAREQTGSASAEEAAKAFDSRRRITIQNLGLIAVALYLGWIATAAYIYFNTLGALGPAHGLGFFASVVTTQTGWYMTAIGCLAGGVFAVIMLGIGLVSFPLALDRDITTGRALAIAAAAMVHNPAVILIWGALVAVMLVLGCLPALLGLALVMPILGHSTWHMYRRLIV